MESTHSPHDSTEHEDPYAPIDLVQYALVVWRFRWAVVLTTGICGVLAYTVSSRTSPTFEAVSELVVSPSKTADGASPAISMQSFRAMAATQSIGVKVMKEFNLDKPPYNRTLSSLMNGALSSEVIGNTNVIAIKARMPAAALAASVANRYAELSVELAQRLSREESETSRDFIKTQLEQSRVRLAAAQDTLEQFRKSAQIELVRADVKSLLSERGRLIALTMDIEGERARLSMAEKEFAKQERVRSNPSALDVSSSLRDGVNDRREARPSGSDEIQEVRETPTPAGESLALRAESLNPYINPVYEFLDQQIALSRTRLASLEKQQSQLVTVLKLDAAQLTELPLLYRKEAELARLQGEFDLANRVYMDLSTRYENARVQVASRTAQLQVLDLALPPDRHVSPKPLRDTIVASGLGFALSVAGCLLFALLTVPSRPPSR